MEQTTFRGTREELKALLRSVPGVLSGRVHDSTGLVEQLLLAMGVQALTLVKTAFLVKAKGGTDEAGLSWAPLNPKTIAYHRRHPALDAPRRAAKAAGRPGRPLLTDAQDRGWRGAFVSTFHRLKKQGVGDREAKGNAAALAWVLIKARGGRTILNEYGNTPVEILRDTGRLLNSISPGSGSPDQILKTEPGAVILGSNVEYAPYVHKKRPLWPEHWPETWTKRLGDTLSDGLKLILKKLAGG